MAKDTSVMLKGVGLLMMIMCHISVGNSVQLCELSSFSLWKFFSSISAPVPIFLLVSGYGLRCVYDKGDNRRLKRLLRLFIHYWIISLSFVFIGAFVVGLTHYPGSIIDIFCNITAFYTTWNYECWFVFPFCCLSLLSLLLFRMQDKIGNVPMLIITFVTYLVCGYVISRFGLIYKEANPFVYNAIQIPFLLFEFMLGAAAAQRQLFSRIAHNFRGGGRWFAVAGILVIASINYQLETTALHGIMSFFFVSCFVLATQGANIKPLHMLGRHSMNMWMIHPYFINYIFQNEIYSLKYTILVFIATVLLSLLVSLIVNVAATPLKQKLHF